MSSVRDEGEQPERTLSAADLAHWVELLGAAGTDAADAERIDRIAALERLKASCAALQAALTQAFTQSQIAASRTGDRPVTARKADEVRRSVAGQVALARKDSPARGSRHVGFASAMTQEMPHTYAALQQGEISEWRATLLVRETACHSLEHRAMVDAELADRLGSMGDKQTAQAAARIGQRLDPLAWVKRYRKAVSERRVSVRPAPDLMTYVTALLPVKDGVSVYAARVRHADCARAAGDERTRGQVMADEFVARLTQPGSAAVGAESRDAGSAATADGSVQAPSRAATSPTGSAGRGKPDSSGDAGAAASSGSDALSGNETRSAKTDVAAPASITDRSIPAGTNIDIQLIMTDRSLFDCDNEPTHLTGYGPIPAPLARQLLCDAEPGVKAWIRRLYTDPETHQLITGDARGRFFGHAARQFLIARDQTCRTPFCDAPIQHADHVDPHANSALTNVSDGQGLCERCNYTKQSAGWVSKADEKASTITVITSTGHTYRSQPPPPPRSAPWPSQPAGRRRDTKHTIKVIYPDSRLGVQFEYVP